MERKREREKEKGKERREIIIILCVLVCVLARDVCQNCIRQLCRIMSISKSNMRVYMLASSSIRILARI